MTVRQIHDFLDADTHTALRAKFDHVEWVRDDRPGLRHAAISAKWDGFAPFLIEAAKRLPLFRALPFEIQVTRMIGGESFADHRDALYLRDDDNAPLTTFVYYAGDRATFAGGRLFTAGEIIEPADNSLVLFDGLVDHSIELLEGDDARRLTINGCYKAVAV